MVSSFGISGSKGSAFSLAILTIIRRKASDTVSPIAPRTALASFLMRSSIRARTTELAVMDQTPCATMWRKCNLGSRLSVTAEEVVSDRLLRYVAPLHTRGEPRMAIIVGTGDFKYRIVEDWAKLPDGWSFKEVGAVGV